MQKSRSRATTPLQGKKLRSGGNRSHNVAAPRLSARLNKAKTNRDESIASDYSTPTTTRTPMRHQGRVPHLIYRPLELDNESSSESNDHFKKRRYPSQGVKTPLAIEAPPQYKKRKINLDDESPTQENKTPERVDSQPSQVCITPPTTPKRLVDFVPGNCNISEIMRLYSKT